MTMRRARQEARRILRKECCERFCDNIGKFVFRNAIPHVENEAAARLEDTARLLEALNLVRKEHHAELAGDRIKLLVLKRQRQSIGLLPDDWAAGRLLRRRTFKH